MTEQGMPMMIGSNPKVVKATETAKTLAKSNVPILIVGEAGTGKKQLCHYIANSSSRAGMPFQVVDCAREINDVQNDILGHRDHEGKFHKGVLERANGGVVVLANIDALDESFQKKLFTILSELSDFDIDVRLMATTSKNLSKYVGAGRFHRGLYTFFSSSQINLPPLRERKEDIPLLTSYFADKYSQEINSVPVQVENNVIDKLSSNYWTHNVKELELLLQNSIRNCSNGILDLSALEAGERKNDASGVDTDEDGLKLMTLRDAEKMLIKKALIHTSENRTQAARILGVSIRTLRNKINEYRVEGTSYFVNLR